MTSEGGITGLRGEVQGVFLKELWKDLQTTRDTTVVYTYIASEKFAELISQATHM